MFDSDTLAYTVLGLSLSISALQICNWLLNANPRAVLRAGQWSVAALFGLTPALLLWLVMTGRSTLALMLGAIVMPVLIWGAPRRHALFDSPSSQSGGLPRWDREFNAPVVPHSQVRPEPVNPDLVRQSIAVLTAYVQQAAGRSGSERGRSPSTDRLLEGAHDGAERPRMSVEEALGVLGLEPTAEPHQISQAHHRLQQKLKPELGDTHYLITKIDEAMNILLKE
jgi:hypothetical protein